MEPINKTSIQEAIPLGVGRRNWAIWGKYEIPLLEQLFPLIRWKTKLFVLICFVIFETIFAQLRFFLPDNPVPVTMQTFGVLMMGSVLGWRLGLLTILSYVILGILGIPLFKGWHGGIGYFLGATGGYIIGFFIAVPIMGYLSQRGWTRSKTLWAMLIGNMVIYIPALIWLSIGVEIFGFTWPKSGEMLSQALYPFIIGDLLKMVFASLVTGLLWQIVDSRKSK